MEECCSTGNKVAWLPIHHGCRKVGSVVQRGTSAGHWGTTAFHEPASAYRLSGTVSDLEQVRQLVERSSLVVAFAAEIARTRDGQLHLASGGAADGAVLPLAIWQRHHRSSNRRGARRPRQCARSTPRHASRHSRVSPRQPDDRSGGHSATSGPPTRSAWPQSKAVGLRRTYPVLAASQVRPSTRRILSPNELAGDRPP
jgi:hypothetical protein